MANESSERLNSIIAKMMSCDYATVSDANDEFRKLKIDEAGGIMLLEAAAKTQDCSDLILGHPSGYLIEAAGKVTTPKYYELILRDYADYKQSGKSEAIRILLLAGTPDAYETLQTLMQQSCKRGDLQLTPGMASSLSDNSDAAELPFVECLIADLQFRRPLNYDTAVVVLGHLQKGWISERRQQTMGPLLTARVSELLKVAKPLQQSSGETWKWEEDYLNIREELTLLMDIYGSTKLHLDEKLLREVLNLKDVRLQFFAGVAMLSRNIEIPREVLKNLGAAVEVRNDFYDRIQGLDRGEVFPLELATNKQWLKETW